jgi:hypothetical protein
VSRRRTNFAIGIAAVAIVAIGFAAFASYRVVGGGGSQSQALRAWVSGSSLGSSIGTVLGDSARVSRAVATHQQATVIHTVCGVLVADAETANGNLPSPNGQLSTTLADAYQLAYDAGNDCYASGGTNHTLLARSARERAGAVAKLNAALAIVTQATGEQLSTTTTTEPGSGGLFG